MTITVGSLFSGIGGLELGLERGWQFDYESGETTMIGNAQDDQLDFDLLRKERDEARAFQKAAEAETTRCGRLYVEACAQLTAAVEAAHAERDMHWKAKVERLEEACWRAFRVYRP